MPQPNPSWFEHVDLMNALVGSLFLVVCWFMIRTLKSIDVNQKELFERMHRVEKSLYTLQGEHNAQHKLANGQS